MNKLIKIITGIGVPLILAYMGVEWPNLSNENKWLCILLMIICFVCSYLASENEKLQTDKEKLTNKIEYNQRDYEEQYQQLKDDSNRKIERLNNKISTLAIQLNGNCPYTIQTYIKAKEIVLRKGMYYEVEVMVSSTAKEFDLKYINIMFNQSITIEQKEYHKSTGIELKNKYASFRCGAYEYSFINNTCKEYLEAKCSFRIMYMHEGLITMTVEVINSENNTTGKKIKELNFK